MMKVLRKTALIVVSTLTLTGMLAPVTEPLVTAQAKSSRVYIAPYQGKKYHFDKRCRGLRKARTLKKVSVKWAKQHGYKVCKIER